MNRNSNGARQRTSGKRGAKNRQNNSNRMGQMLIPHPPQIPSYEIVHGTRMRFLVAAAGIDQDITFRNLLDLFIVASTATVGYDLFNTVKIRGVEVWAGNIGTVLQTPATVTVQFRGTTAGAVGDLVLHTDTSMTIEPAHVLARPSRRSTAALYQPSGAGSAMYIKAPPGAVIDVELSFRQQFLAPVLAQNALVGATVGAIYLRGLDGLGTATSVAPPALIDDEE